MTDNEILELLTRKSNDVHLRVPAETWAEIAVRFEALAGAQVRVPEKYIGVIRKPQPVWHRMTEKPKEPGMYLAKMRTEAGRERSMPVEWQGRYFTYYSGPMMPVPEELMNGWTEVPVWNEEL